VDSAKGLNKDYELGESEDLSTNLQQFLKHIGELMSSQNSCPVKYLNNAAFRHQRSGSLSNMKAEVLARQTDRSGMISQETEGKTTYIMMLRLITHPQIYRFYEAWKECIEIRINTSGMHLPNKILPITGGQGGMRASVEMPVVQKFGQANLVERSVAGVWLQLIRKHHASGYVLQRLPSDIAHRNPRWSGALDEYIRSRNRGGRASVYLHRQCTKHKANHGRVYQSYHGHWKAKNVNYERQGTQSSDCSSFFLTLT
jgi:hypothetical protein